MADWLKVFQIDQTVVSSEVGDGRGWERMGEDGRMEVDGMKISEHSYGVLVVVFFPRSPCQKGGNWTSRPVLVGMD